MHVLCVRVVYTRACSYMYVRVCVCIYMYVRAVCVLLYIRAHVLCVLIIRVYIRMHVLCVLLYIRACSRIFRRVYICMYVLCVRRLYTCVFMCMREQGVRVWKCVKCGAYSKTVSKGWCFVVVAKTVVVTPPPGIEQVNGLESR